MSKLNKQYDVIVVGLGAAGSSTLYQCSKKGWKCLGIEQFTSPHNLGSSHGQTRITREAILEGPEYVPLVQNSYKIWEELNKKTDLPIFTQNKCLIIGDKEGSNVKGTLKSAQIHNLKIQYFNSQELKKQFSNTFQIQSNEGAVLDYKAGFLHPENIIKTFLSESKMNGAELLMQAKMLNYKINQDETITVNTDCGSFNCKNLVLSLGMWMVKELSDFVQLQVKKIHVFWFDCKNDTRYNPENMPVFLYQIDKHNYAYGFPKYGSGIKIGISPTDQNQIVLNPDNAVRSIEPTEADRLRKEVARFLPEVSNMEIVDAMQCYVTMTKDEHFIIDFHPNSKNILVLSPCSAHGFKYSGGIGMLASQMIETKEIKYVNYCLNRFNQKAKL